ncbi:MAG TPA: hypothetical protein VGM31_10135 [Puia sp.]
MKKVLTVVGSLLLVLGVRAQSRPQAKKETKQPAATNSVPVKKSPVSPAPDHFYKSPASVQQQSVIKKPNVRH